MVESVSNQCLISSAISGVGITILPEGLVHDLVEEGALKIVHVENADFSRKHYLLIHKNKKLNPIQKQAYQICLDLCSESQT